MINITLDNAWNILNENLTTMIKSGRPLRFEVPEQGWKYYDEKYLEKDYRNCTATERLTKLS